MAPNAGHPVDEALWYPVSVWVPLGFSIAAYLFSYKQGQAIIGPIFGRKNGAEAELLSPRDGSAMEFLAETKLDNCHFTLVSKICWKTHGNSMKKGLWIYTHGKKGITGGPWPLIGRRLHFSLQCILPSDILNHSCRTKRPECKWKLGMFQIQKDKKFGSLTPKRRVWAWGSILAIHKPVEMTLMERSQLSKPFPPTGKYCRKARR